MRSSSSLIVGIITMLLARVERHAAVERRWHIQDSQGQILALVFIEKSVNSYLLDSGDHIWIKRVQS